MKTASPNSGNDVHTLTPTATSAASKQADRTEYFEAGQPCGSVRLACLERAGVQTSLSRANTEGIGPEGQHGQPGAHCKKHRERSGVVAPGEQRIDGTADREQQRIHDRERHSDRQQRQPGGLQVEPDLRARRRHGGTRESEQADEPVPESSAWRRGSGRQSVAAALACHRGDRQTERRQANRADQRVVGAREVEQRRPQMRGPVVAARDLHCCKAMHGQKQPGRGGSHRSQHLDQPVAGRPVRRRQDQVEGRDPRRDGHQRERVVRGHPQEKRRHEVYRRRQRGEVRHRNGDEYRRPNRTGVEEIKRKAGPPAIELRHRQPPHEVRQDDEGEGDGCAEVPDDLALGREHGQYGRAPDNSQSQAPGDLDAGQPPVLPQHRPGRGEDG